MDGRMVRANRRGFQGKISRKMLIVILVIFFRAIWEKFVFINHDTFIPFINYSNPHLIVGIF